MRFSSSPSIGLSITKDQSGYILTNTKSLSVTTDLEENFDFRAHQIYYLSGWEKEHTSTGISTKIIYSLKLKF